MKNISEKILIIDDQRQNKRIIGNILNKAGYEIYYANSNDQKIISTIENSTPQADLLILDTVMSGVSGIDIVKNIREKRNSFELPVLFASEQIGPQLIELLYKSGGSDYISIPCMQVELLTRVRNLLDMKQYYKDLQISKRIMEQRTKIVKMNTHDLKNPLSSIFSLSGMLASAFSDTDDLQQTLSVIHDSSKFMLSLVNETLDYIRMSSYDIKYKKELVEVTQLVNQVVEVNSPLATDKKQKIHFEHPNTECYILADNEKIFRAVNNIVSNAIKFSPFGKNIWIEIVNNTDKILIKIKDEGPGFKSDELPSVFNENRQYSAKPTGGEESTGLGLMITKLIITQNGGEILLDSKEGAGSTFKIIFNSHNL